jgi:hypothetical protein
MRFLFPRLLALGVLLAAAPALHASLFFGKKDFSWENAVIHLEVVSKDYSYVQPWAESERKIVKTGVVIPGHLILTTADGMANQTMIRLQKEGGGLFSLGSVVWVDYQANLCAITTDEKDFWTGLQPVTLADPVPITGSAHLLHWDGDHLDDRPADIEQMIVNNSALSFVSVPELKIDTTVTGLGFGEILASGNRLIGLVCQQEGDLVAAVPSSFISSILKARQAHTYTGLGYFDFTWDPVQNPLNLQYLKLPGPARGVIVKEIGLKPGVKSLVHSRDVLLNIDGFDIDSEGNYRDPQYKKLVLENLSSRQKWAGMTCQFKILREGKELNITYRLPKADYRDELVPSQTFDQSPQYVLAGGFVFVPLTEDYLRSWGSDWRQHAPFRLAYYENGKVTPDRSERVVLSQVLPDPVNIGYESLRNVVVDKINGLNIRDISDVAQALKSPVNGFDVFTFAKGEETGEAVLDATGLEQANTSIMARFHIRYDHVLNSEVAATGSASHPTQVTHQ